MSNIEIVPADRRFNQIKAVIHKECAPLVEELGEEVAERLQEIASTRGKDANGQKARVRLAEQYIAGLPQEQQHTAGTLYGMYRRAWRGLFSRFGKLYYIDEDGNETRTADLIAAQPESERGKPIVLPKTAKAA